MTDHLALVREHVQGALKHLDDATAEVSASMSDEAVLYWKRRAIRAEGNAKRLLADDPRNGPRLAALVEMAIDLHEARRAGDKSAKRRKVNMGHLWADFHAAVAAYVSDTEDPDYGRASTTHFYEPIAARSDITPSEA